MRGFSKAIIAGNLTRDPEVRTTQNGSNVTSFSVAVNRVYRDANGEQKEAVSFIDCSAWGRLGETIAQYAKKGSGVLVSGRLDQRSWEDKTDGKKRSRVEIVAEDFVFTSGNGGGSGAMNGSSAPDAQSAPSAPATGNDEMENIELSEIPF